MKTRALTVAAAGVAAALALAGCQSGATTGAAPADDCAPAHPGLTTLTAGTLTIAGTDYPPYSQVENGVATGVDGDIVAAIAEMECLTITVKNVEFAAAIPSVQNGQADLAFGDWYRTAERAEVLNLTDPTYSDQMGIISVDGTTAFPDLKGKAVGAIDGTLWLADLKDYYGGDVKVYQSASSLFQDLNAGRVDAAIDSYGSALFATKDFADKYKIEVAEPLDEIKASLEAAQTAFPMTKSNTALLEAFNADIAELRESGQLADILVKYGFDKSAADPGDPRLLD